MLVDICYLHILAIYEPNAFFSLLYFALHCVSCSSSQFMHVNSIDFAYLAQADVPLYHTRVLTWSHSTRNFPDSESGDPNGNCLALQIPPIYNSLKAVFLNKGSQG